MGQNEIQENRITTAHPLECLPYDVVSLTKSYVDGQVSDWHWHDRWQLIHAVKGLMIVETQRGRWAVPTGAGMIVPPKVAHTVRMIGAVELRTLYIAPDVLSVHEPQSNLVIDVTPLLALVVQRICSYGNDVSSRADFDPLCQIAVLEMAAAKRSSLNLPFPPEGRLTPMCMALISDPGCRRSIDDWAYSLGMSRRAFTRAFYAQTGLSFGNWLQRLRCQSALEYEQSGLSLDRIAPRLGYSSKYALRKMMARFT